MLYLCYDKEEIQRRAKDACLWSQHLGSTGRRTASSRPALAKLWDPISKKEEIYTPPPLWSNWSTYLYIKLLRLDECHWLTPIILPAQEAEIRRIAVQSQPRQGVLESLSHNYTIQNRASEVVEHLASWGSEFIPQDHHKYK
jgi:hypothetical protein